MSKVRAKDSDDYFDADAVAGPYVVYAASDRWVTPIIADVEIFAAESDLSQLRAGRLSRRIGVGPVRDLATTLLETR